MNRRIAAALALALVPLAAPQRAQEPDAPPPIQEILNPDWATAPPWNRDEEELCRYDAVRVLRGRERRYTLTIATYPEELNREYMVPAEWPYGQKPLLPALLQDQRTTVSTGYGEYDLFIRSTFERATAWRPLALTVSVHDPEGAGFKSFEFWHERPRQIFSSPWDGEGSGTRTLESDRGLLFEEQLPLLLRGIDFAEGARALFALYPPQSDTHARVPLPATAILEVNRNPRAVVVPAGEYLPGSLWNVRIQTQDSRELLFQFEQQPPHRLVAMESGDGTRWRLASPAKAPAGS